MFRGYYFRYLSTAPSLLNPLKASTNTSVLISEFMFYIYFRSSRLEVLFKEVFFLENIAEFQGHLWINFVLAKVYTSIAVVFPSVLWTFSEQLFCGTRMNVSSCEMYSNTIGDHSFCTFAKFSEKLTFLNLLRTCAYQGVRNVSFSEDFADVLNEWSPSEIKCKHLKFFLEGSVRL